MELFGSMIMIAMATSFIACAFLLISESMRDARRRKLIGEIKSRNNGRSH